MGKDVVKLSLLPDAVSDTQDFDGLRLKYCPMASCGLQKSMQS